MTSFFSCLITFNGFLWPEQNSKLLGPDTPYSARWRLNVNLQCFLPHGLKINPPSHLGPYCYGPWTQIPPSCVPTFIPFLPSNLKAAPPLLPVPADETVPVLPWNPLPLQLSVSFFLFWTPVYSICLTHSFIVLNCCIHWFFIEFPFKSDLNLYENRTQVSQFGLLFPPPLPHTQH